MSSAKTLFHDVSRAPVAVLLIVLGLCAGLGPLAGSAPTPRTAHNASAFARLAASPLPAQAAERFAVVSKGTVDDRDTSFGPLPPRVLSEAPGWNMSPGFGGQPVMGLRQFSANLYHARAPPAV